MTGMKDAWASGAGLYRAAGLQAQHLPSEHGLRTRLSNKDVAFPSGQQLRRQSIPTAWAAL